MVDVGTNLGKRMVSFSAICSVIRNRIHTATK